MNQYDSENDSMLVRMNPPLSHGCRCDEMDIDLAEV